MKLLDLYQKCLNENIQLADKIYFNTGKLSEKDKKIILGITKGNNYTKIITDFYFYLKQNPYGGMIFDSSLIKNKLKLLYDDVLAYNKNVYPVVGYDVYNLKSIPETLMALETRRKIIQNIKKLPSIAIRNLKNDIREERDLDGLKRYYHDLEYFMGYYSLLNNRDYNTRVKVLKKMLKSNITLSDLLRFIDDKENLIGGVEFTKDDIKKLSETEDFEIIYEQGEVMIVRVDSPSGIKAIGCNSLWCFTYGSGFESAYRQWNNYSHNDMVYVLIDFREKSDYATFMHVLISPLMDEDGNFIIFDEDDNYPLFDLTNENYFEPYSILKRLFGSGYKKIVKKYLNFEH